MVICVCEAVREREVDAHIARGCRTVRELTTACGAGGDCGACVRDLRERLVARRAEAVVESKEA
ncbi:MAG: (2Fe-2S)-binding protein [Myxococcota bacterium]|nr:(2Fe-2S)-binding protein [Myxococcota bacterium]